MRMTVEGNQKRGLRPALGSILVLLMLLLAQPLSALDPTCSIHQYGRDRWTRQNGLPGSVVTDIRQLPGGYIWLRCGGKIYRFDGVRFTPFPLVVNDKPLDEGIRALGRGRADQMLVRTAQRFLYLKDGHYTDARAPFHIPDGADRVVLEARDGTVWLGTDNHIYRLRQGRADLIANGLGWVRAMLEDRSGGIWIGSGAALYHIRGDRMEVFPTMVMGSMVQHFLPVEGKPGAGGILPNYPSAFLEDRDGVIWIGTFSGLWKYKDGVLFQDKDSKRLGTSTISALIQDRDGNVWAGTEGHGLYRLAGGRWSHFGALDGLSDDHVLSLEEDQEGGIWIGTRTALERFGNAAMLTLTTRDGLSNDDTNCILEARDGSVYVFTSGGITRWKGDTFQRFTTKDGLASDFTGNLFESRDGTIWSGTDQGLCALRNGRWRTYTCDGKLLRLYISAISEDDQGLILACSDLNLYRFRDGNLSPYNLNLSADGKPAGARYAFTMLADSEGNQWFALSGGLYRVNRGQSPENAIRTPFTDTPLCLTEDSQGYIWLVGSNTGGFAKIRKSDNKVTYFPAEAGAEVEGVGRILFDRKGNLWVSTRSGIFRFERDELDAYAEGRIKKLHSVPYGILDGLQTEDCSAYRQPAAWCGRDGRFYFSSRKGVVTFHPDRLPRNTLVPAVHIEEVVLDKRVCNPEHSLTVEPGAENIEIHYSATSLRVPSRVRFKYQLVGFDPDWVDAGARRTAYYTHIPPGTYQFRVIACNDDGLWNHEGATFSLKLKPRFYQTLWFGLALLGGFIGMVVGIYRFRTRQLRLRHAVLVSEIDAATRDLKHHQEHLESMVQERTQELQGANAQLQSEIQERQKTEEFLRQSQKLESVGRLAGGVAHDFNNLVTVINGYSELILNEPQDSDMLRSCAQEIRKAGERAASLTKQLLAFSRKQVLQPEIVDLNLLIHDLEKMLTRLLPANIRLAVTTEKTPCWILVDPSQVGQVVMNLVVNARDAMPDGGTLLIETEHVVLDGDILENRPYIDRGSYVRMTVTDTGMGMDEETKSRIFEPFFTTKEAGKGTGLGLATVFGIVKQSNGFVWVYSEVGKGTSFKIFFPVSDEIGVEAAPSTPALESTNTGETILVVEDQDAVRNLVIRTLLSHGFTVLDASDAEQALALLEAAHGKIDLLFTDVVMPGMNGRELGRRVQEKCPRIKVIYTSGYTENLVQDQGILEPGLTLLQKPFSARQLLNAITDKLREG